jgi:hypothetical protein
MGLALALTGEVWHTAVMRNKEFQLLYVGNQYRQAIQRYYIAGPSQYPRSLEDLLKDQRRPGIERYLRKLYYDPVTGKNEWGLVKAPDGGILGVYSTSEDTPLKTAGFGVVNANFEGSAKYSDWKFVFTPGRVTVQIPVDAAATAPNSAVAATPAAAPAPAPR